jgi:Protein of unknown function (DUF2281)
MTVEEQVLEKLRELPPQRQREVLAFVSHLREKAQKQTRKSLQGLWADLNVNVSDADIREVRREMWGSFPREIS